MFLKTAAIIAASVVIVGALGTIPLAWKSKGSRTGTLWVWFIVVALAFGVAVIAHQTGLIRGASYTTISLILVLAYAGVRVAALKNAKAGHPTERKE
jgi:hypothetical protein